MSLFDILTSSLRFLSSYYLLLTFSARSVVTVESIVDVKRSVLLLAVVPVNLMSRVYLSSPLSIVGHISSWRESIIIMVFSHDHLLQLTYLIRSMNVSYNP